MQRWKSNPIPCYVHSPQKSYASSSSADYRGAICQSLLSDRSILSNAPCRLSDNRAVLTVCHDSFLNRGPIRRRFQVWLMSLYPFYLFTNWKFLQWRLILAWQTLELEKDLKGSIWTPWIVLDRLGLSLVQSFDKATIAAVLPPWAPRCPISLAESLRLVAHWTEGSTMKLKLSKKDRDK